MGKNDAVILDAFLQLRNEKSIGGKWLADVAIVRILHQKQKVEMTREVLNRSISRAKELKDRIDNEDMTINKTGILRTQFRITTDSTTKPPQTRYVLFYSFLHHKKRTFPKKPTDGSVWQKI